VIFHFDGDATVANYQSAVQTPGANVIFAGHSAEAADPRMGRIAAGGVSLDGERGVGDPTYTENGQPLAPTGKVQAASVGVFACNANDLAGQYAGTTFTGTSPGTNTVVEDAGAAAYADAMVRGKSPTDAAGAAEAAMAKTTTKVNRLPENKDHPFPRPQVCTTNGGQQTCQK